MSARENPLPTAPISSIGYVDEANLIESLPAPISPDTVRVFENEEAAQAALQAGGCDWTVVLSRLGLLAALAVISAGLATRAFRVYQRSL